MLYVIRIYFAKLIPNFSMQDSLSNQLIQNLCACELDVFSSCLPSTDPSIQRYVMLTHGNGTRNIDTAPEENRVSCLQQRRHFHPI